MKNLKESIGIDVSKNDFKVCFGSINEQLELNFDLQTSYSNDLKGIKQFIKEITKISSKRIEKVFVMEATGVYHELLAHSLYSTNFTVVILLPNKAKYFCQSINIRTKSDKVDAKSLCQMGLERKLKAWEPPSEIFITLKTLTRERESLVKQRSILKNKIHAYNTAFIKENSTLKRIKKHMLFLDNQIKEVEECLKKTIKSEKEISEKIKNITKIKGLSLITVATIIAETSGFTMISNIKQVVGYAGLDVKIEQSGTKNKKGRISKKGNSHIRNALYMPALNASRSNVKLKEFYNKLTQRQSCKKQGIIAIQRKLLILTYSLWKSNQEYIENKAA